MSLSARWLEHNTAPERSPAIPSVETMSQLPPYHPTYWTALAWLIHQIHSQPREPQEFLHNNTLRSPQPLLCSSPTAVPKASAGNFRLYAEEKKSTKFKRALWLLLLLQENGPHVRVSSYSASQWYAFLLSKGCSSDPTKKRTGEDGVGCKWREN